MKDHICEGKFTCVGRTQVFNCVTLKKTLRMQDDALNEQLLFRDM